MRKIRLVSALAISCLAARAQHPVSLPRSESDQLFPGTVKTQLGINYPIFKVFRYHDQDGSNYVLLTESEDSIVHDGANIDTLHHHIKAISLTATAGGYTKKWEINDFIDRAAGENSIWFWSKSCSFTDLDGDGLSDIFIAYSTGTSEAGTVGGRLKLILYYKGNKIAIRHQDCELDDCRETLVDAAYYALPEVVQQKGIRILKGIVANGEAYLGSNWVAQMAKHKRILQ